MVHPALDADLGLDWSWDGETIKWVLYQLQSSPFLVALLEVTSLGKLHGDDFEIQKPRVTTRMAHRGNPGQCRRVLQDSDVQ